MWERSRYLAKAFGRASAFAFLGFSFLSVSPLEGAERPTPLSKECVEIARKMASSLPHVTGTTPSGAYLSRQILSKMKKKLGKKYSEFEDWYFSHFFYSRTDQILANYQSKDKRWHYFKGWDRKGERPLKSYQAARKTLFDNTLDEISISTLHEVHTDFMSRSSVPKNLLKPGEKAQNRDALADNEIGVFRNCEVGYEPGEIEKGNHSLKRIDGRGLVEHYLPSGPVESVPGDGINPLLVRETKDWVAYAPLKYWQRYQHLLSEPIIEELSLVTSDYDPHLKIQIIIELSRARANIDSILKKYRMDLSEDSSHVNRLRRRVMEDVVTNLLRKVKKEIGSKNSRESKVNAISDFYHDFISIHPYRDGNGGMGRLLVERLLAEIGLPAPIWEFLDYDGTFTKDDCRKVLNDSIDLSQHFHTNLKVLIDSGADYHTLSTPYISSSKDVPKRGEFIPEEFMAFVAASHSTEEEFERDDSRISNLIHRYFDWKANHTYRGTEVTPGHRSIGLFTPLFMDTFNRRSRSQEEFDLKLETFYPTQKKMYRGFHSDESFTDAEIVSTFHTLDEGLMGMGVSAESSHEEMRRKFETINAELVRTPDEFNKRYKSHLAADDDYWKSGMVSFSEARNMADSFARGALFDEEDLTTLKSAMVVTALIRNQGVIFQTKPTAATQSIHAYGESEVTVMGAVDPESVVEVQVEDVVNTKEGEHPTYELGNCGKLVVRNRVAKRIGYNKVQLSSQTGEGLVVSIYEIIGNSRTRLISRKEYKNP